MENVPEYSLLGKYNFNYDKEKLIMSIIKNCHIVFNTLNEDGERDIYLLSDLEISDEGILSFVLTKDDLPVSVHNFSIKEVYNFDELNKLIVKEINS